MRKIPLLSLALLLTLGLAAGAQKPPTLAPGVGAGLELAPPRISRAPQARTMTPEALAAWNALSPEKRKAILAGFQAHLAQALADAEAQERSREAASAGQPVPLSPIALRVDPRAAVGAQGGAEKLAQGNAVAGTDSDLDGLSDSLEVSLAQAFAPGYFVSGGEASGTSFAHFADSIPQTVSYLGSRVPPFIHYRVTPVGVSYATGVPTQLVQIDYLSLWNRDDGLQLSTFCNVSLATLGLIGLGVDGVLYLVRNAHDLDNERTAVLVAAPLASADNPNAYAAYDYYLAAHENTPFFDHSTYATPSQPVPPGTHFAMALSRAKHATYLGIDPNGLPIFQSWVIASTFAAIDSYFLFQYPPDYYSWSYFTAVATDVFYGCVVEHFTNQGGSLPGELLNVGELSRPINGSSFINDTNSGIRSKLSPLLWVPR
ncbi:MAG TPA: hypothetical protein PK413_08240 [Thermoanaerobaculia bacterium]|nr:hypothetical protein [Thermoanaerobaculia bacterium]